MAERFKGRIHAVVTNVVMPKMHGPEVVERLRKARPDIRAVFMSGYADDAIIQRGVKAHTAQFLQKSFTPQSLKEKLREALGGGSTPLQ